MARGCWAKSDLVCHHIEHAEIAEDTLVLAPSNLQFVSISERIFPALLGEPRVAESGHDGVFRERAVSHEVPDCIEILPKQQPRVLFQHICQIVECDLGNAALDDYVEKIGDLAFILGCGGIVSFLMCRVAGNPSSRRRARSCSNSAGEV
jgi:hypothetical protein